MKQDKHKIINLLMNKYNVFRLAKLKDIRIN